MSEAYAIKTTTLTALGDAVRSKVGVKYILKEDIPAQPNFSIDFDSRDYDMTQWTYSPSNFTYTYKIPTPIKETLGDTLYMYSGGRPTFLVNFTYETNMAESLIWDWNVTPSTGGVWNQRYVSKSSTFLTREVSNQTLAPSNNGQQVDDEYYIYLQPLKTKVEQGLWFKFHFDIRIMNWEGKFVYLNTFTPIEMAENIINLETIPPTSYNMTGSFQYKFTDNSWNWFIDAVGDKITTSKITGLRYAFDNSNQLKAIPFEINTTGTIDATNMFSGCSQLREVPMINNLKIQSGSLGSAFNNCYRIRYFPDGFGDNWNFTDLNNNAYSGATNLFYSCYSLRKAPQALVSKLHNTATSSYSSSYSQTFYNCFSLDEIIGLGVSTGTLTSNVFNATFTSCGRLANLTFAVNQDGTPKTANWKAQTINLSTVGWLNNLTSITNYNSGITADKQVIDNATYQALKNDEDWFSLDVNYSRYNHDSAVNTINSLPDCYASGGTNTIKFKGSAGALTDAGAINTMTEEEIAVATAKGWTVSFV